MKGLPSLSLGLQNPFSVITSPHVAPVVMGDASTSTEPYSSLGSRGCSNNILPVAVGAPGTSSEPDLPIGSLDCAVTLEETDTTELLSNPVAILTESCDAGCQGNTRGM